MNPKHILIIKLSSIGDVIHALPVSAAIKDTDPEAKITWVVEPPSEPLLRLDPCVDEILLFPKKEFRTLKGFLTHFGPMRRALQRHHYDAVLDLQGLFKSAALAYLAPAPRGQKYGMCDMREGSGCIARPVIGPHAHGHIIERYLDVARAIGCKVQDEVAPSIVTGRPEPSARAASLGGGGPEGPRRGVPIRFPLDIPAHIEEQARARLTQAGVPVGRPYLALIVGANWANKRWPETHIARLADWAYERGILPVLTGGGPVDEQRAARIAAEMDIPPINLVSRTTLPQLAAVLKNAVAAVGGDTGPCHLAAALGTPTLMLMGPTDANRNGPWHGNAIEADHPCKGCWQRACPKSLDCLAAIGVEEVEEKLMGILR